MSFYDNNLFFAKQVINNACATQAILSILMNNSQNISLGSVLKNLREFSMPLDSYSRGLTLGECNEVRTIHNSFASQEPFLIQGKKAKEKDDVYHFVSYIHFKGALYELDGLQEGPICHKKDLNYDQWLDAVTEEITTRIKLYSDKEIRFNLLAVTDSKLCQISEKIRVKEIDLISMNKQYGKENLIGEYVFENKAPPEIKPTELESSSLKLAIKDILSSLKDLKNQRKVQLQKRAKQTLENQRRKHNYLPLIFELFRQSAEAGELEEMYKKALKP